jgi:hypothetical protein
MYGMRIEMMGREEQSSTATFSSSAICVLGRDAPSLETDDWEESLEKPNLRTTTDRGYVGPAARARCYVFLVLFVFAAFARVC